MTVVMESHGILPIGHGIFFNRRIVFYEFDCKVRRIQVSISKTNV